MELIELNQEQVKGVYHTYMEKDFPDNERKPLSMLLEGMDQGKYQCLALGHETELLGYAVMAVLGDDYLLDYLAVCDGKRNQGYGEILLKLLADKYEQAQSLIGEVEDPRYAADSEERRLRERRLHFYQRCGYVDTGVCVSLFGVEYKVIELDIGGRHTEEEIRKLYLDHYKTMLPENLFQSKVKILSNEDKNSP